jgi:hypothetical protein
MATTHASIPQVRLNDGRSIPQLGSGTLAWSQTLKPMRVPELTV